MTLFVSIYTTAVTFYVHSGGESIIFKKDQQFHFGGGREGEETARCGIWLQNAPGLGSSRQSRGTALVWLCCADWLASDKNKMSPQEIGTTLMKYSPSSLYCSGIKGLEMLFLVFMVTSVRSCPHNLSEMWQELDPSLAKNLAPAHESGEISACLKLVAAPGQNNVWSATAQKQSLCLYFRQRAFLSLFAHITSLPQIFLLPAELPAAYKALEQGLRGLFCFALLPQWSVMKSVFPRARG